MKITTTSPVEGVPAEQTIDVPNDRAAWLVANGYATKAGGNPSTFNGTTTTTVPADQDPTNPAVANTEPVANRGRGGTPSGVAKVRRSA